MEQLASLRRETRAALCAECGKCTSVCPLAACGGFSARAIACQHLDEEMRGKGLGIQRCLTCAACDLRCPQGVRFTELVRGLRAVAGRATSEADCPHGGAVQAIQRLMAQGGARQDRLGWLTGDLGTHPEKGEVFFWVGCTMYFDAFFQDTGAATLEGTRAALKVLNALGTTPVVSPEERCCGHDLLWNGDRENFEKLARHNVALVAGSGAKTLVVPCAECLRTWKLDYAPYFQGVMPQVLHLSEFVLERRGGLRLATNGRKRVTYQDPCRLGRHLGLYDAPRTMLTAVPGVELAEMPRSGPKAVCCAGGTWSHCDRYAREIQIERLFEARGTGAGTLVTSCPKCQVHFLCAQQDLRSRDRVAIEMRDVAEVFAEALGA